MSEVGASRSGHNYGNIEENAAAGKLREARAARQLAKDNPGASVQRERYLRDVDGKRLKDPITGEGRRVDLAVIKDGKVTDLVEVTSETANKAGQVLKERRIRELGNVFIRDRTTGELLPVDGVLTRILRRA